MDDPRNYIPHNNNKTVLIDKIRECETLAQAQIVAYYWKERKEGKDAEIERLHKIISQLDDRCDKYKQDMALIKNIIIA